MDVFSAWARLVAKLESTHVPSSHENRLQGPTDDESDSQQGAVEVPHPGAPGSTQSSPAHLDLPSGNDESPTEQWEEDIDLYTPNNVIFGESGAGRSSVIKVASETQHRTDTYKSRVTDQGVHPVPSRNALTSPGSASARLDLRQPRKPKPVTGHRQEDLVQRGDKIPGKNARGELSLATPSDVQIGLAHPDSSRQSRGPKAISGPLEEDLVHPIHDTLNPSLNASGTAVQLDGETLPKNRHHPLSIAPRAVEGGSTHSDSLRQPRRAKSVVERAEEHSAYPVHSTPEAFLRSPDICKNQCSTVQLNDDISDRNGALPVALDGAPQNDSVLSGPSCQPRKPKLGTEQEGLIHHAEEQEKAVDASPSNIIIFGESGVGKSSIINLIADEKLARTSNGAFGCTFRHDRYSITLGKTSCALWDTTGLDEGSEGTVPAREAENNLRELMQQLTRSGGIHLIIYCIRNTRLTRALKRNYDLFYVTVCRKKVPVALVVTGLEHQEGEMETWWTENEAALQRHGMRFDAHACVTTLDVKDQTIRQRRSASQKLLRGLVVHYSGLPAWKTDASFLSRVLPVFRNVLRGLSPVSGSTTTRKVAVCCSSTDTLPETIVDQAGSTRQIGNEHYVFIQVAKDTLHTLTPKMMSKKISGVGLLVFYTSAVAHDDKPVPSMDIEALERFYDISGGQICPMIVVLRGCDDEVVRALKNKVVSRRSDIKADFISLPSQDGSQPNLNLDEMIERLYIEQVKPPNLLRKLPPRK